MIRNEIGKYFCIKEESIGDPVHYIGGKLREVVLENRAKSWDFGSKQYVEAAVKNVRDYLAKRSQKLVVKDPTPLSSGYPSEVDVTVELDVVD